MNYSNTAQRIRRRPETPADRRAAVAKASADYEIKKQQARVNGWPCSVTLEKIAAKHGIAVDRLKNFRANHALSLDHSDE